MCDHIITGNNFILNNIALKEAEINRIIEGLKSGESATNEDGVILLEENRGRDIDIYSMTVFKFYSLVKFYTEKRRKEVSRMKSVA